VKWQPSWEFVGRVSIVKIRYQEIISESKPRRIRVCSSDL
jgi:hypothetical protein